MIKSSIYKKIASKTGRKGWLPDNFSLTAGVEAPGKTDFELLYESDIGEISPRDFEQFIGLLAGACENPKDKDKKEREIIEFLTKNHILKLIDVLCEEIYNEDRNIDIIKLLDVAYGWAAGSDDVSLVKLGISLMGMMNLDDREDCREVIVTLGKYEEFTFYSLYALEGLKDADVIASDYAKNLKGWGKTHAELWRE